MLCLAFKVACNTSILVRMLLYLDSARIISAVNDIGFSLAIVFVLIIRQAEAERTNLPPARDKSSFVLPIWVGVGNDYM